METAGSPKFPGNPRDHSPCSPTPVGPSRLSRPWVSCLARPPRLTRTRAHHEEISGLNRTAFDLAVYASSWRLPAIMQDSLPAAGPALPGGIGYPQGSCERFHGCNDSPFPSFLARGQTLFLVSKTARKNQEQSLTPSLQSLTPSLQMTPSLQTPSLHDRTLTGKSNGIMGCKTKSDTIPPRLQV